MGVAWMNAERFAEKVRPVGDCLLWEGMGRIGPYGVAGFAGQQWLAHRLAFFFAYGWVPAVVRHSCDTPLCMKPTHLLAGTHADNVRDKVERGRQPKGETHWNSKVTQQRVEEIRALASMGVMQKDLAEAFGLSKQQVSRIIRNEQWRD